MQCTENGFQTLEVLREGLWASFTGGWFYDLRQNVFCNTFHLYLWLFLLCFPFIIHLYFPPSTLVSSFYCGTVGVVFIFLKVINHRLHIMFDTSECIQETIPGEDLPESQKKRTHIGGLKTILEDEWFEMKDLEGSKITSDIPSHASFQEVTDDDSINSSETTGQPISSTIDLKVDVHHKNSSESSEDLSVKPVLEDDQAGANTVEECELLEDTKTSELIGVNLKSKHTQNINNNSNNNKHFKNEEDISSIQDADLILSLSDCHIAKVRNDSIDDLSQEYKISQSECHISKFFHNNDAESHSRILPSSKKFHLKSREPNKKKYRKGFSRHLGADNRNEEDSISSERNDCFEIGNLASKGSCGLLTLNQNKEQIRNTGSLELPLNDSECSNLEKGLLYWKQKNLGNSRVTNLRENVSLRPNNKFHRCSDTNIHSPNRSNAENFVKRLKEKVDLGDNENQQENEYIGFPSSSFTCQENSVTDLNGEQSFLQILEENFDWYSSEYQHEKSEKLNFVKSKINEISNCKSDEDINKVIELEVQKKEEEKKEFKKLSSKSEVQFQVDSDEDSSDNCGSRSPLLCRHESLEKETKEKPFVYNERGGMKILRTFSTDEGNPRGFNKMIRTLSVDEDVISSKKYKNIDILPKVERGAFGSVLFSVYDDVDIQKNEKDGKDEDKEREKEKSRAGKSSAKRHSFHSNNKTLTCSNQAECVKPNEGKKKDDDSFINKDVLTWVDEKVALEWLFGHSDTEMDNQIDFLEFSMSGDKEDMSKTTLSGVNKTNQSQGAIPKTKKKLSSNEKGNSMHKNHDSKSEKLKSRISSCIEEFGTCDGVGQSKKDYIKIQKNEREDKIIDEEEVSEIQNSPEIENTMKEDNKQLGEGLFSGRNSYDASNNSNFELSSLLPLSSLLSSLNPPSSPLLAAFLATRKDLPGASHHPGVDSLTLVENDFKLCEDEASYHPALTRSRNKRIKRSNKFQRASRSSTPLAALASVVSSASGTHIATSHEDTSQGAVHCFQDERGNWISYTFDNSNSAVSPLQVASSLYNPANRFNGSYYENQNQVQSIMKHTYQQNSALKDRDLNFGNNRLGDEGIGRRHGYGHELRKLDSHRGSQSAQTRAKPQIFSETCDSNINLVSNSNSENESSLSLNSTNISPVVDVCFQHSSFKRDRMLNIVDPQCSNSNNNNNNNNNYAANVVESNAELGLNEGRNNDNNNNGMHGYLYFHNCFGWTDTIHERNRQRNVLHSPTGMPDCFNLSLNDGNETEVKRNNFRLFDLDLDSNGGMKKHRHYYKLYYTPLNYIKIRFDRLELIALLDRNLTVFEVALSIILSVAVSVCGITLLNHGFYRDLVALFFCFTIAGCHYSLLKSVQPDATSPTHGYNRIVIYSRSIYFCLASLLIIMLTSNLEKEESQPFNFYNLELTDNHLFRIIRDGLLHILLLFPILFTLGVFPQINTFSLYILEQTDIHVLGGNAMTNLIGAVYCVSRSATAVVLIYGFAYGALSETKASQHILFSIFCGLLISLSYHLSRSSSNPTIVWDILKNHLFQDEILQLKNQETKTNKSVEESIKNDKLKANRNDGDDKSDSKNSQNNLLLNSNPSSNETLKTIDTQLKSNFSENFDNSGNASEIYNVKKEGEKEFIDPLPGKLKETVNARLKNDAIVCCFIAVLVFGLHSSTVFSALQPDLNPILWGIAGCSGVVLHYIVPQLRKQLPWLCLARPVLRSHEYSQFEVRNAAKVMWFEETYVILSFLERNLLYPVLVLATLTYDGPRICECFGIPFGALITSICGLKMMRSAFSNTSQQYLIVIFTALLFEFDYQYFRKTFLIDYFFMGIVFSKTYEFLLKMQFVVTYIAPWQITWGSTFHAFAQLFSVPHSALLLFQTALSALLSAPLNPFLGSALFFASYVRPVKFWERDYNTKRVDHSNTRLSSHLERNLGSDDNNLNSIFYEHLTRSLQHNLCGDLELGRWGPAYQGDCFILASDYLNCLVHIIEMGNGLVTFQMRGLEFRGTFCQQREVEAISEGVEENDGCCCCQPGHLPNILSVNAAFSQRWLAWEVTSTKYVLEGYSISDNSAKSMLQAFDFRKVLVTYYVKSIIFYCVRSPKLNEWLNNTTILAALEPISDRSFVDLDPVFNVNIDQDFDIRAEGITRSSFCDIYLEWIQYCASKREKAIEKGKEKDLISLCLALSLMGRRTLGTASHNTVSNVEFFLYGLHALFKGDFRVTSIRDEWIFSDIEFLKKIVAPGVRMSLKLHQDHFMSPEEYENPRFLYEAISNHEEQLVISHEGDPVWREAVLSGTPSLLALRHVLDDGADEYKIIMLNKRFLSFRVIKLNRECVRGLWAGQQQELVFFRNRNPERGSIQNAKQVLRNIINSSCDQPIGYPIYVSPLTTSYSETNEQFSNIIGGPLSLNGIKTTVLNLWRRIRQRCAEGCSSGNAGIVEEVALNYGLEGIHLSAVMNVSSGYVNNTSGSQSMDSCQMQLGGSNRAGSLGRSSLGGRGSLPSVGKPSSATLASLAGLLSSAELPKGENFLRERETSFTLLKDRSFREEKDCSKKLEKLEDLKMKFDERDKRKEEIESRKEKKIDFGEEREQFFQRVRIIDPNQVFDAINLGRRIDVLWPDEGMRARGGRSHWKDWLPDTGMEGQVVHRWIPNHRDPSKRSHVDKIILLVKIDDRYVPIAEAGVQDLGAEV